MKIDRLLGILSILLQQEKVTAPYLAGKFEVSRRTINRDIEDLCKAGIPLVTTQGKYGGISIMEGYKIDKTLLTSSEMQAILSGLRSLDSVSGSNRYQLLMDKFLVGSGDILPFNNHILINLSSWYKSSLVPKIELIQRAIELKKQISFCYYSPAGECMRFIDPYYLVFEWSSWYVWGYCYLREDFRLFKLNRLEELQCLDEPIKERSVPEFMATTESGSQQQRVKATVIFDAFVKWRLIEEFGIQNFQMIEDGRIKKEIIWADKESLISWLLSFRDHVEVVGPEDFRKDFIDNLQRILSKNTK